VARAKPISTSSAAGSEHCGPSAPAPLMKLTINMPLMIYWQALGEALAALPAARSRSRAHHGSALRHLGRPNVLKVRGAGVAAKLKGGDAGPVTFDVDSALKDLRTMLGRGQCARRELRSWKRRSPATRRPSRRSPARRSVGGVRSIGRTAEMICTL